MTTYRFEIEIIRDGNPLARLPIEPDWSRAFDCLHFQGARTGRLPALAAPRTPADLRISPVWATEVGEPYIDSVHLTTACSDGEIDSRVPRTYFAPLARAASTTLVNRGVLKSDDSIDYRVTAIPAPDQQRIVPHVASFDVEEVAQDLTLTPRSLRSALAGASVTDVELDGSDMPLLVARSVLEDALARARGAGDIETGGILVGHLYRDTETPEIFAEITAQIPAVHTAAEQTKLTFTAETWAAASVAVKLRRRGEQWLGFWHSHPDWCRLRGCPPERRVECSGALPFLSPEDVHLFGTCFGYAHNVTFLMSDHSAHGWTCTMYGWRRGVVARRPFHIPLQPSASAPASASASPSGTRLGQRLKAEGRSE